MNAHLSFVSASLIICSAMTFGNTAWGQDVKIDTPGADVRVNDDRVNRPDVPADRSGNDSYRRPAAQRQQVDRLDQQIAQWVQTDQRAIVNLAQFGLERTKTPEVRRLAEMIVDEHQELSNDLAKYADTRSERGRDASRADTRRRTVRDRVREAREEAIDEREELGDRDSELENRLEGLGNRIERGAERLADRAEQAFDRTRREVDRRVNTDEELRNQRVVGTPWLEIHNEITEEVNRVVRTDFEKYEGRAFDNSLVGMLVAAHLQQEATLTVLSGEASEELADRLSQALQAIQSHRQQAEQVMESISR